MGHVGTSNVGYDEMHGGFGYGDRNADGSRILAFADGLNLVICNTLFMKQESQLVTYAAGPVKSVLDRRTKQRFVILRSYLNEECVPNHKLLVMDMQFNTTKRWHKKFERRVCVWKFKEKKTSLINIRPKMKLAETAQSLRR